MSITCVIPCLNEEATIGKVVSGALRHCDRVIVVDNGSTDNTIAEARKILLWTDIYVYLAKGAGAATGAGLGWSLNPHYPSGITVTLDGDGQHDPDDIPLVVNPIVRGDADFVIGSRFLHNGYRIKLYRKLGISVLNHACDIGTFWRTTDTQSGFRAFNKRALEAILPVQEHGFGFIVETLMKARKAKLRIVEVPIRCIYNGNGSTKDPLSHGVEVLRAVAKWRLKCGC